MPYPSNRYEVMPSPEGGPTVRFLGPTLIRSTEDPEAIADEVMRLTEHEAGDVVWLDLAEVEFVNAATLTLLLALAKRLGSAGRQLRLVNVGPMVAEVFEVAKLTEQLGVGELQPAA
jgi:anti-anti-sigma factor